MLAIHSFALENTLEYILNMDLYYCRKINMSSADNVIISINFRYRSENIIFVIEISKDSKFSERLLLRLKLTRGLFRMQSSYKSSSQRNKKERTHSEALREDIMPLIYLLTKMCSTE